jgi:hypothetical protein
MKYSKPKVNVLKLINLICDGGSCGEEDAQCGYGSGRDGT